VFGRFRTTRAEMALAGRMLSYSIHALITAKPMARGGAEVTEEDEEEEEEEEAIMRGKKGATNSLGAWCWREDCDGKHREQFSRHPPWLTLCAECLRLTKNLQLTADTIYEVAELQERNVRIPPPCPADFLC
jgi:sorting nexin-9/18/33